MKKIVLLILFILITISISWADDSIKIVCPGGVLSTKSLVKKTIKTIHEGIRTSVNYTTEKDKCYKINDAKFVYLIDKKHVVYSVRIEPDAWPYMEPQLFLFEYKDSAQWRRVSGIIKGKGEMFNYKDYQGISLFMPKVIVVKENKI